ncbi:hypothetical protein COU16_00650 [Candidatus Kaiserbacteria bacterium CG10_big_fil_rev_8_21_14_0_10_47_16]|uniref:Uncharacterized protein n=1 Tax=Candidatus Kaiserbacteria bacterium CG10_big_fil_rev_8_21_14_0_10_47_16 TaxID=1974608 RepID=A0A2H0UE35_9BACT|nr:MAG: hypothetical protein COU16_00650 [Candidatus Kaiserbacteria bacterium CG10_big_fil_rev_8_21_14_0_10_47_16]
MPVLAAYPVVVDFTSNTSSGTASSLTLTKTASAGAGDVLLLIVGNDDSSNIAQWSNFTDASGDDWTLVNEAGNSSADCHSATYYRVADGGEAATVDVPAQSLDDYWGFYVEVSGANTSTPIDAVGSDVNVSSGTSISFIDFLGTELTTTADETLAFYVHCFDGGDGFPFNESGEGWVEGADIQTSTSGTQASGSWGTKQVASAGLVGVVAIAQSAGDSDGYSGFQFSIAPDPTPPPAEAEVTRTMHLFEGVSIKLYEGTFFIQQQG